MCNIANPLVPVPARIIHIKDETPDTKTFQVIGLDGEKPFNHQPGQCAMIGIPGVGEAMFSIASSPTDKACYDFSIKGVGKLTHYLHHLSVGAGLTLRGAYGRAFPVDDELRGRHLLFVAGGIGIAPLRSVIRYVLTHRENYGKIAIVYGARSSADLVYLQEMQGLWAKTPDLSLHITIDRAETGWEGHVGFVPAYLSEIGFNSQDTTALVCGPPVMIKYAQEALLAMGFTLPQIYTTLEMRMKCGIGQCGRCNIGPKLVCKDGPVFRCDELENLPEEY